VYEPNLEEFQDLDEMNIKEELNITSPNEFENLG
jgi:hypothetical protein